MAKALKALVNIIHTAGVYRVGEVFSTDTETASDYVSREMAVEVREAVPVKEAQAIEEPTQGDDGLANKTVAELQAIAEERGINVTGLTRKADILRAVREG